MLDRHRRRPRSAAAIGHAQDWSFWLVFALQILIGAIIVAIFTFLARPKQ